MPVGTELSDHGAQLDALGTAAGKNVGTGSGDVAAGNRGMPTGGADGDVLTKTSGTDYAVAWETPSTAAAYVPRQIEVPWWSYTGSGGSYNFSSNTNYVQVPTSGYIEWPVHIPIGVWRVTVLTTANATSTGQVSVAGSNLGSAVSGATTTQVTVDADYTEATGTTRTLRITAAVAALRVSGIALTKQ